jgi:hypothetical protein
MPGHYGMMESKRQKENGLEKPRVRSLHLRRRHAMKKMG